MAPTHYCLEVFCVGHTDINWKKPRLYAKIGLGKSVRRTGMIDGMGIPLRDPILTFTSSDASAVFDIRLKERTRLTSDRTLGRAQISIAELLSNPARQDMDPLPIGSGRIYLRLRTIDVLAQAEIEVMKAEKSVEQIKSTKDNPDNALGCIIKAIDTISGVVDSVVTVSPLLELSWKAASAMYKLVSAQMQTDQELINMVDKMRRAFDFSVEVRNSGEGSDLLRPIVRELLDETVKCSRFVQNYTSRSFMGRMLHTRNNQKVVKFTGRFVDLRNELDSRIALETRKLVVDIRSTEQAANYVKGK